MDEIKVSAIIPVYGVEKYIERCARSLFEQSMTDGVEFIFVNDCTPDRSLELLNDIIGEYPGVASGVKILNHIRNRGLAAARQTGLDAARGQYIIHLDSDDYFEHDMLEVMYQEAIAHNSDVVVADFFKSHQKSEEYCECFLSDNKEVLLKSIIARCSSGYKSVFAYVWNKLVKRSIFQKHNINSIEGINVGEDLILTIQTLYYANVITKVDQAFVHYNNHNLSSYSHNKSSSNTRQCLKAIDTVAEFLSPESSVYDRVLEERRFYKYIIGIVNCERKELPGLMSIDYQFDYMEFKHLVAPHWKLPVKFALQGKIGQFVFLRNLIFFIRKVYRIINGWRTDNIVNQ
ncbi:MAG: glycosyltransferase family 2 protein [Bacteroidales bacterium]|nr:glycosyltransferase family 2 protein [Bacteroidales bacterium]